MLPLGAVATKAATRGNLLVSLGARGWRVTVLRPHWGWAGPRLGYHVHSNVVVEKDGVKVRNWHVARYRNMEGEGCWYVFESVARQEWDTCQERGQEMVWAGASILMAVGMAMVLAGGAVMRAVLGWRAARAWVLGLLLLLGVVLSACSGEGWSAVECGAVLRACPAVECPVVDVMNDGDTVEATGARVTTEGMWIYVHTAERKWGWVRAEDMEICGRMER